MTDIDVPDWVVDKALDAWDELSGHPSEEHRMRAAIAAALPHLIERDTIGWMPDGEEKCYVPQEPVIVNGRVVPSLDPPKVVWRRRWRALLVAVTRDDEPPPQDIYRLRKQEQTT